MNKDRSKLTTESRNRRSHDIDRKTSLQIVDIINSADRAVASAVARQRKSIAAAVDMIVECFRNDGRLFYVGAGTSGRLGVLDASECPPTFGTPPNRVQGIIAGGRRALVRSIEGAEDRAGEGAAALDKSGVNPRDVVAGIAACGVTPFVHGAVKRARQIGARTIFITCAPEVVRHIKTDIVIAAVVGPEVITGSTRMKAGTATKLILNTLTTAAMIRIGKVYGNLMVDLRARSDKLRDRAERIIMTVTGLSRPRAQRLLAQANGSAKPAIVMHFRKVTFDQAQKLLESCNGSVRKAAGQGCPPPQT